MGPRTVCLQPVQEIWKTASVSLLSGKVWEFHHPPGKVSGFPTIKYVVYQHFPFTTTTPINKE